MFHRQTLFVIGAGASVEVDFPAGRELARSIAGKMDIRFGEGNQFVGSGDEALYRHILSKWSTKDEREWLLASRRLQDGLPFAESIDDFLDQHRNDQHINLYGKAAIAKAIVEAERKSRLFFDEFAGETKFDDGRMANTWLVKFMSRLSRGIPQEQVANIFDNVDFIVFNYDRCVEHFLINALRRSYSIRYKDAAAIVNAVEILHPYGSVGDLISVPFGSNRVDCLSAAEGIKTYTEQAAVGQLLNEIREKVETAECIVFLGFAYHSQNMQMLEILNRTTDKVVYGTTYDMSDPDVTQVKRLIMKTIVPKEVYTDKLKCAALFDHYAKSLTGGD